MVEVLSAEKLEQLILKDHTIKTLLLGNGFSQFVSDLVGYQMFSAQDTMIERLGLQEIANKLDTTNIEQIMSAIYGFTDLDVLADFETIFKDKNFYNLVREGAYKSDVLSIYNKIKEKFIIELSQIHPDKYNINGIGCGKNEIDEIYCKVAKFIGLFLPRNTLNKDQIKKYEYSSIFTINYDLILYWALATCQSKPHFNIIKGGWVDPYAKKAIHIPEFTPLKAFNPDQPESPHPVACDGFAKNQEGKLFYNQSFNSTVYYMHGLLVTFTDNDQIIKFKYNDQNKILDQVKNMIDKPTPEWPSIILDGDPSIKEKAISSSTLSRVAYKAFIQHLKKSEILCIFGCSFRTDRHLLNCIKQSEFTGEIIVIDPEPSDLVCALNDKFRLYKATPEDIKNIMNGWSRI